MDRIYTVIVDYLEQLENISIFLDHILNNQHVTHTHTHTQSINTVCSIPTSPYRTVPYMTIKHNSTFEKMCAGTLIKVVVMLSDEFPYLSLLLDPE